MLFFVLYLVFAYLQAILVERAMSSVEDREVSAIVAMTILAPIVSMTTVLVVTAVSFNLLTEWLLGIKKKD